MLKSVWLGGIWSGSGDPHSSPSLLIACASELKVLTVARFGKMPVGRILCFDWICCVEDKYEALFELHVYIAGWSSRRRCQLPMPTSGSQQRSAAIDAHSLSSVIVSVLVEMTMLNTFWQARLYWGIHSSFVSFFDESYSIHQESMGVTLLLIDRQLKFNSEFICTAFLIIDHLVFWYEVHVPSRPRSCF